MSISGDKVVVTKTLKWATECAIRAAQAKKKDPRLAVANAAQIELLQMHMTSGEMTSEELKRGVKTIALLKADKIRYNLSPGFVSTAETERVARQFIVATTNNFTLAA